MTTERLAYVFRTDSYALWLTIVGLSVAARIVLEVGFRAIDRATALGGTR